MTFFRYPGGKTKIKDRIIRRLSLLSGVSQSQYGFPFLEYREPFFGGGSIGTDFLQENRKINRVWINDIDPGVANLWTALIKYPEDLKDRIKRFVPTIERFAELKSELTELSPALWSKSQVVDIGFKKLAIHQISYSGLGTKSGGPLGGLKQESKYKIDCRWSPFYICKRINMLSAQFSDLTVRYGCCTNLDFGEMIVDGAYDALLYLDPPYYCKGGDLYQYSFDRNDHRRLAALLACAKHEWLLSYDDCEEVRRLYCSWANVKTVGGVNYTITDSKDKETGARLSNCKEELLIDRHRRSLQA